MTVAPSSPADTPSAPSSGSAGRLRRSIRALARRFALSERSEMACCGMTVAQAGALETLRLAGAMRAGDLGRRLGIRPSTVTRNLDRLEQRGLVRRRPDPDDARAATVELTIEGSRAATEVERQAVRFFESVLDQIPAERRRRVEESLAELVTAVRRATDDCCPGAYDHLLTDLTGAGCEAACATEEDPT